MSADVIQTLIVARICPLQSAWNWEALPHKKNSFLVNFPSMENVERVDGFELEVPKQNSRITFGLWRAKDIIHTQELTST